MTFQFRFLLVASCLIAAPMAGALAQSNPTGNLGSNQSITASHGTVDKKGPSEMSTSGVNAVPRTPSAAAMNRRTPGGTGTTVVRGSSSTISGDRKITADSKTGAHSAN